MLLAEQTAVSLAYWNSFFDLKLAPIPLTISLAL